MRLGRDGVSLPHPRLRSCFRACKRASSCSARQTLAPDEQRESRGAVGARLLRGRAKAPSSWLLGLLLRVLARASVRAAEWRTWDRGRRLSQAGMRIRAGVAPGAVRLESSRYGPGCDFACAVSDPEPSPRPQRGCQEAVLCEGSAITRPGSIEAPRHLRRCGDRGTTSSMAVRAALLREGGHWDFVWDFAHFRGA